MVAGSSVVGTSVLSISEGNLRTALTTILTTTTVHFANTILFTITPIHRINTCGCKFRYFFINHVRPRYRVRRGIWHRKFRPQTSASSSTTLRVAPHSWRFIIHGLNGLNRGYLFYLWMTGLFRRAIWLVSSWLGPLLWKNFHGITASPPDSMDAELKWEKQLNKQQDPAAEKNIGISEVLQELQCNFLSRR